MNNQGLKPCPFCGGNAKIEYSLMPGLHEAFYNITIKCTKCYMSAKDYAVIYHDAETEPPELILEMRDRLIDKWNRRVNDA